MLQIEGQGVGLVAARAALEPRLDRFDLRQARMIDVQGQLDPSLRIRMR